MRSKSWRSRPRSSLSVSSPADPRQRSAPRQYGLRFRATGSPTGEENRQFFQCRATCSRQYNVAGGIVQFEAVEGNGDELAGKSGKIADGKNNENAAILAKNEIVDPPDRNVFVVDHRHQFKRFGTIAFCGLRG